MCNVDLLICVSCMYMHAPPLSRQTFATASARRGADGRRLGWRGGESPPLRCQLILFPRPRLKHVVHVRHRYRLALQQFDS